MTAATLRVEVAFATPHAQVTIETRVPPATTVAEAIRLSGVLGRCPEIDLAKNAVGIFGERARLDDVVQDGDRVEIYRPLIADPKEARRRRARAK
ncbi:MAG: RnfH family protein [Pseudomonadota bacterium]